MNKNVGLICILAFLMLMIIGLSGMVGYFVSVWRHSDTHNVKVNGKTIDIYPNDVVIKEGMLLDVYKVTNDTIYTQIADQ